MDTSALLYSRLAHHSVDFVVSVPCKLLDGVIQLAMRDKHIVYTPVTREEEGVGVLAGASPGGRHPALLMQNSGLGNCLNAICSLVNYYVLPVLLITEELVVCNIGHPCQELFSIRDRPGNFYMLGSMGMASSIGLGLALSVQPTGTRIV